MQKKNRAPATPLGDYLRQHHTDVISTTASLRIPVLRWWKDVASLKITELKYIRDLQPKRNTLKSSWKLIAPP